MFVYSLRHLQITQMTTQYGIRHLGARRYRKIINDGFSPGYCSHPEVEYLPTAAWYWSVLFLLRRHDFLSVYVYFNVTEHPQIRLVLIISRFLTDVPGTNLLHNVKRRHFGKFRIYTLWDVALSDNHQKDILSWTWANFSSKACF